MAEFTKIFGGIVMTRYTIMAVFLFLGLGCFLEIHLAAATNQPDNQPVFHPDEITRQESINSETRLEKQMKTYCDAQIFKLIDEKLRQTEAGFEKKWDNHFMALNNLYKGSKDSFDSLIRCAAWLVALIITLLTVMVGIAATLFWKKERTLKERLENHFDEIKALENHVEKMNAEFKARLTELETLKHDYESALSEHQRLKKELQPIIAYRDKKIIWAYEVTGVNATQEIEEIRNQGFRNVSEYAPDEEKNLSSSECDCLIYHYRNTQTAGQRLKEILSVLKAFDRPVPLIIYTYPNRIAPDQMALLSEYRNYIISNMPLTLISYLNSLIRN